MLVSWTFPVFARDAGQPHAGAPFACFALMMIVQFIVIWVFFPETKRVALEEMNRRMKWMIESEWTPFDARVVPGHRVASGLNGNPRFPGGTLRMQAPFFDVRLVPPGGERVAGLIYYPHPETKPEHFQKPDVLELLLPFVAGLRYGETFDLEIPRAQMAVFDTKNPTECLQAQPA